MKVTFLFGLLLCLTPLAPAVSRLLDVKSNSDVYGVVLIEDAENGGNNAAADQEEEHDGAAESESDDGNAADTEEEDHGAAESESDYESDYIGTTEEPPKDYGYGFAEMIWYDGYYDCENITEEYWVDVQNIVFTMCDFKWMSSNMWKQYSQECQTGAAQYVSEEMDNCSFDVDVCSKVGISAAASVAGTFCKQNELFQERTEAPWLPATCVEHATVSCKYDAVQTVQRFNQGGVCAQGSALDYIIEIHQLCEQEVSALALAANPTQTAGSGWY